MNELTGKQKRFLRGAGQVLPVRVRLGKSGRTEALLEQIRDELRRRELVRVRMASQPAAQRKIAAAELAEAAGAALAGLAGHVALLYRANPALDADDRIALPD